MKYNKLKNAVIIFLSSMLLLVFYFAIVDDNFYEKSEAEVFSNDSLDETEEEIPCLGNGDLPSSYSIYKFRDYPAGRFNPNVGDQKETSLCWAFASTTALESTIYTLGLADQNNNGIIDEDEELNFSELDLAYTVEKKTYHIPGSLKGGVFELAYGYFSSEYGPVNEQSDEKDFLGWAPSLNTSSDLVTDYENKLHSGYIPQNAGYSVMEAMHFPSKGAYEYNDYLEHGKLDDYSPSEGTTVKILNLRQQIKTHIMNVGGVTASLQFEGRNNEKYYNTINNMYFCNVKMQDVNSLNPTITPNHMVTIVGWDDKKEINGHTGFYIVQNSYGVDFGLDGFFYIPYDDPLIENNLQGFKRVIKKQRDVITYNKMEGSHDENQFLIYDGNICSLEGLTIQHNSTYFANFFQRITSSNDQILSKIKVPTAFLQLRNKDEDGKFLDILGKSEFRVYVLINLTSEDMSQPPEIVLKDKFGNDDENKIQIKNLGSQDNIFESFQSGFYGIDIDNENITISGEYFAVIMECISGYAFYKNNNPAPQIPTGTYFSTQPTTLWELNKDGDKECIFPMIVETQQSKIEYSVEKSDENDTVSMDEDGNAYVEVIYNGQYQNPNIKVTSPQSGYIVEYKVDDEENFSTYLPNLKDVKRKNGEVTFYTIYVRLKALHYSTTEFSVQFTIHPKEITITPIEGLSKVYGTSDPIFTYSKSGIIGGEIPKFMGRLSRDPGETVGSYKINQGSLVLVDDNYSLSFTTSEIKFNITGRLLYVYPSSLIKVYGDSDPTVSLVFENLVCGEIPGYDKSTLECVRDPGEDVGSYTIKIKKLDLENNGKFQTGNYILNETYYPGKRFEIVKRALYIVPEEDQSKTYGEPDPTLTYSYNNQKEGEVPNFTGDLSRESGEDAGRYKILQGELALGDNGNFHAKNYTLQMPYDHDVYFEIKGCTFDDTSIQVKDVTKEYDGQDYTAKVEVKEDGILVRFCEGEYLEESTFNDHNPVTSEIFKKDAGIYNITVEFSKKNYITTYKVATLTINPKNLEVTPNEGQHRIYGEEDDITFGYTGNVSLEIPNFSGKLEIQNGKNVGSHPIVQGSLALENNLESNFLKSNYTLKFNQNSAKYTIDRRDLIIIPDLGQHKKYNEDDVPLSYSFSNVAYDEIPAFTGELKRETGDNVGLYEILPGNLALVNNEDGNFIAENYTLRMSTSPVYFSIEPADIKIKIDDVTCKYGDVDTQHYSYTFVEGSYTTTEDLELTYLCYDNEGEIINNSSIRNADGYDIEAICGNPNYNVEVTMGKYYIEYNLCTITFNVLGTNYMKEVEQFSRVGELPSDLDTDIEGYYLRIWKTPENKEIDNITSEIVTKDAIYVADMIPVVYQIDYIFNGGKIEDKPENILKTTYTVVDDDYILLKPKREGYIFNGWFNNANFDGDEITKITKGTTQNKIFYAKFTIMTYTIKLPTMKPNFSVESKNNTADFDTDFEFSIHLDDSATQSYATMIITFEPLGMPESKKVLLKQDTLEDGSYKYIIPHVKKNLEVNVEGIVTNKYIIQFIADGKVIKTSSPVLYGQSFKGDFPEIPHKEHYDDTPPQWSESDLTNIHEDKTVTVIYTPDVYNITFVMNDGKVFTTSVVYGEEVSQKVLQDEYNLGLFQYFEYDHPLTGIGEDTCLHVKIVDNTYVLYVVVAILLFFSLLMFIVSRIRSHLRHKFRWWVYKSNYTDIK